MAKEFNTLLEQAEIIRTEIEAGANTANRVGGTIKDIVETMKAHTGELNMSVLYPESGDSGKFTLKQAVEAVPADMRPVVRKLVFMDYSGDTQEYNFNGLFSDANFLDENNWTKSGSASNFLNLGDIQNVETARKGINPEDRKPGLSVTYRIAQEWKKEQYVGVSTDDMEWAKDGNWVPFDNVDLVDSYESYSKTSAPTADALRRLHLEHVKDITDLSDAMTDLENKVNAVLDMVSSSSEIGVSPASIEVSSEAQDVRVQIICNGDWTVSEVPESVEVTPLSGTGNGYVTVKFPANESEEDEVTGSFKITNSFSKGKTVSFTQHAAEKTYVYELSVLPASLELGAAAGNGVLSITSKRTAYINGSPAGAEEVVSFTLSSDAEWLHVQNTGEYTYDENTQENSRSAAITVTQDGGKVVTVDSIQDAAVIEWVYEFTVSPQTVSLVNAGTAQTVEVTSRKQKRVNGVNDGDAVSVDYSSSATAGFKVSGNSISADQNNTENAKSGTATFTQNESGKKVTVDVTQPAGTVSWQYTFSVDPDIYNFTARANSQKVTIVSYKRKLINGVQTGEQQNVGYSSTVSYVDGNPTGWLSATGNTVKVTRNGLITTRNGSVTFTQSESGKTGVVSVKQSPGYSNTITCTIKVGGVSIPTEIECVAGYAVKSDVKVILSDQRGDDVWNGTIKTGSKSVSASLNPNVGASIADARLSVNYNEADDYLYDVTLEKI